MMVKLVRLTLKSDPNTILPIKAELGTIYEVIGYDSRVIMVDKKNNKIHELEVYHIANDDVEDIMPCELFELIES